MCARTHGRLPASRLFAWEVPPVLPVIDFVSAASAIKSLRGPKARDAVRANRKSPHFAVTIFGDHFGVSADQNTFIARQIFCSLRFFVFKILAALPFETTRSRNSRSGFERAR
jgi:hypothetical protein